jgi:hypothetical protein
MRALAPLGLAALLAVGAGGLAAQQNATRFAVVDVYIDSAEPLAAWQFELRERHGAMQVVGIESGESASFDAPPFYDRDAVARGSADRIVVASYSLAAPGRLPTGRTRVASVHVRLRGAPTPDYRLDLIAAGGTDGRPIAAAVSLATRTGE